MWQSQAQLVRLRLPPPCPPLEPWHPTHPAPAIPRPNIPLRSGSACRRPLQYQVSVCSPASDAGSAPPALAQATGPVCGGVPLRLHPHLSGVMPLLVLGPRDSWLRRWCGEGGGVEGDRVRVGGAALRNKEWAQVWVQQEVCLHTCQRVEVLRPCACGVCVNGEGDVWDWLVCGLATLLAACLYQAGSGVLLWLVLLSRTPDLESLSWGRCLTLGHPRCYRASQGLGTQP